MAVSGSSQRRWVWLPAATALAVWLMLLGVTVSPELRSAAAQRLPWMLEPLFHDWHVVHQGWRVAAQGIDPLEAADQPFNYPRAVLLGGRLGGTVVPVAVAGLLNAAVLLALLVWLLRPNSCGQALVAAALLVSPPLLLLLERGNLDAWVLALVVGGVALLERRESGTWAAGGGAALLAAATVVKLFPAIILLGALVRERGWRRGWPAGWLVAFGAWALLNAGEIVLILRKTGRGLEPAYGRLLASARYWTEVLAPRLPVEEATLVLRQLSGLSLAVCVGLYVLAVGVGWYGRQRVRPVAGDAASGFFVAGALAYAGTFLLGNNWSYRLVFLLLCVPALWRAGQAEDRGVRRWAGGLLAGIVVLFLSPFRLDLGWFFAREVVAWGLATGLAAGAAGVLAAGVPRTENAICAAAGSN